MTSMYGPPVEHYGVKGMKWGIRRTPAQLGHAVAKGAKKVKSAVTTTSAKRKAKKKAEEDRKQQEDTEAKKNRILKSRSAKLLYQNADLFTTQELQTAYNRLNLERNIANLGASEKSSGRKFVDGAIGAARKTGDFLQATNKALNQGRAFVKFINGDTSSATSKKTPNNKTNTSKKANGIDDNDPNTWPGRHFSRNSKVSSVFGEASSLLRETGRDFARDFQDAPQALSKAMADAGRDYVNNGPKHMRK